MRERYDDEGNVVSMHRMIFDSIPDDYKICSVIIKDKLPDLSYLSVMKHLRDIKAGEEFENNTFYSSQVLSQLSLDYLNSARFLHQGILKERGKDIVSYYLIPCAFLCKHSIELKLKECMIVKGKTEISGHSVLSLWNQLNEISIPQYTELSNFLSEVEKIDNNEMALRYGISKKLTPLQENFKFDIDVLISNTMFLFNIIDEYIICRYRYKGG